MLKNDSFRADLIIGRDFFEKENLTLILIRVFYSLLNTTWLNSTLFAHLPFCVEEQNNSLEQTIDNLTTDFGYNVDKRLKALINKTENRKIIPVQDDYCVKVRLKDDSVYAYAPRRFAHAKRLQMRKITDNLL